MPKLISVGGQPFVASLGVQTHPPPELKRRCWIRCVRKGDRVLWIDPENRSISEGVVVFIESVTGVILNDYTVVHLDLDDSSTQVVQVLARELLPPRD